MNDPHVDRFPKGGVVGDDELMRLGIAHHYGWAVAVVASADYKVVDRRRVELIDPDLPPAPIHHEGGAHELHRTGPMLDDESLAELVEEVRASVFRSSMSALDALEREVPEPITSMSVRAWPADFPDDVAILRRSPYESRADSVMYCQILAEVAESRGWEIHTFEAKTVEQQAATMLGDRADEVLYGPRKLLGPPWNKDHRIALAATVVA